MAIETGTYVVLSAASTGLALDVTGGSDSNNGKRVQLWTRLDNDAQLVRLIPTGSNWYLQFILSGKQLTRASETCYIAISRGNIRYLSQVSGNTYRCNYDKVYTHSSMDVNASSRNGYLTLGQTVEISSTTSSGGYLYGTFTSIGSNDNSATIVQWDASSSGTQNWKIVADGKTVTVGGVEYPTYIVRHPSVERALDISGASYAAGTQLQLWDINGSDAQRWVFVPQNPIPDGTYEICPYVNNKNSISISGGSTALGAAGCMWARSDYNYQKWVVETDSNGITKIKDVRNGNLLEVKDAKAYNNATVQVYKENNNEAQWWVIEPATASGEVNDQASPYYRIHVKLDVGFVMDNTGGGTTNGTSLTVWTQDNSYPYNQLWRFEPTEYLADDLPVPSNLGASLTLGGASAGSVISLEDDSSFTLYPRFDCSGTAYQMRYRFRTRTYDMDEADDGEFSEWLSIFDGSAANDGWGDIQTANCEVTQSGNTNWANSFAGTVSTTATDLVEYQYEVRRYATSWGKAKAAAHGNSATGSFRVVVTPVVSVTGLTMTPAGLAVTYESSFPRGGNTVVLSCPELFSDYTVSAVLASDSVVVPYDELITTPDDGSSYEVSVALTTVDGGTGSSSNTLSVSYDSNHGTSADYGYTVNGANVEFDIGGSGVVYLEVKRGHGDRLVPFETDTNGKVTIIPPLNTAYRLYIVKGEVTGGGSWATKVLDMSAIETNAYHITSLDGTKDVAIELNEGEPPAFEPSYARDLSFATTTGRERNVAAMGTTTVATWNLAGVFYGTYNGTLLEHDKAFDIAAHMGFCIFRAPNTFWAQAAITASSYDMSRVNVHSASFSFKEIEI